MERNEYLASIFFFNIANTIKPVNLKGNQSWIFIRRTDAEALTLWPPEAKSQLIRKNLDSGKDLRQEKGTTEDKMVGWHHQLHGHGFDLGRSGRWAWHAEVHVVTESQTRLNNKKYILVRILLTLDLSHHTVSKKVMYVEALHIRLQTWKYVFWFSGYYLFNLALHIDILKVIWIAN